MQMTPLMAESEEELKSLLMRVKEESETQTHNSKQDSHSATMVGINPIYAF